MIIGIQSWGTEGDIRPLLALAGGLRAAGHEVRAAVTDIEDRDWGGLADRLDVELIHVATPVVADEAELDRSGRACIDEGNPIEQARIIVDEFFDPVVEEMYEAAEDLCRGSDAVVGHHFLYPLRIAADQHSIPEASVILAHGVIPSPSVPPTGFPDLGAWANRLGWWIARKVVDRVFLPRVNELRRREGLPPAGDMMGEVWSSPRLNLVAVSPQFCPTEEWDSRHRACGFFRIPERGVTGEIPETLEAFVEAGERPLYVTFGSLTPKGEEDCRELVQVVRAAVRAVGCRAILQLPERHLAVLRLPDEKALAFTSRLPHRRVFPRCAAVVHHGGSGTTHSVTLAGVPSVVVAHVSDQFFWADRLRRLGIAPKVIPRRSLDASSLASRIETVLGSPEMSRRARRLGAAMQEEDGVRRGVEVLERELLAG